jgi:succinate dehydrogenase hydrophobic anchor subunit
MSDSMDNFWLVTAVRYGLPALLLLVAALLGLIWTVGQRKDLPPHWRRARHAWAFTLFGITVAAATVHLWNALFVLFFFLIGAGAWLLDAVPGRARPGPARRPDPRPLRPARLF